MTDRRLTKQRRIAANVLPMQAWPEAAAWCFVSGSCRKWRWAPSIRAYGHGRADERTAGHRCRRQRRHQHGARSRQRSRLTLTSAHSRRGGGRSAGVRRLFGCPRASSTIGSARTRRLPMRSVDASARPGPEAPAGRRPCRPRMTGLPHLGDPWTFLGWADDLVQIDSMTVLRRFVLTKRRSGCNRCRCSLGGVTPDPEVREERPWVRRSSRERLDPCGRSSGAEQQARPR